MSFPKFKFTAPSIKSEEESGSESDHDGGQSVRSDIPTFVKKPAPQNPFSKRPPPKKPILDFSKSSASNVKNLGLPSDLPKKKFELLNISNNAASNSTTTTTKTKNTDESLEKLIVDAQNRDQKICNLLEKISENLERSNQVQNEILQRSEYSAQAFNNIESQQDYFTKILEQTASYLGTLTETVLKTFKKLEYNNKLPQENSSDDKMLKLAELKLKEMGTKIIIDPSITEISQETMDDNTIVFTYPSFTSFLEHEPSESL
jgi:hypothetical protein